MAKTRGGLSLRLGGERGSRNPVDIPSTSIAVNTRKRKAPSTSTAVNTRKRKGVESDRVQQSSVRLKSTFQTKSRPFQLIKLIRGFTEKQKTSVREIGFGGLLNLKLCRNPTTMFSWLVDSFDPGSCMFCIDSLKCFPISEHDVYDVFCLSLNPNKDVDVVSRCANKFNPDFPLKQQFRSFFGFEDTNAAIPLELLERLIPKMTDGGDEFKQLFVLHAISSFLAPTHNRTVDLKIVKSIMDPDKISTFNWCKYVLDHLCDSVVRYRKGKLQYFCGCVVFLEIVYFHRLKFKNISLPSSLPLISHWTDKDVTKRIKEEVSAHHFGNGIILTTYPVSESMVFESGQALGVKVNHIDVGHPSSSEQPFRDQPPQSDEKIEFQLPLNAMRNSDIHQLAGDEIYELLLLMRRDTQVVSSFYMDKIKFVLEQKRLVSSPPVPQPDVPSISSTPLSQTQRFFMNPTVLNTIDEIVDIVKWVTSIPEMVNEGIVAGEGNAQVNEGDDFVDDILGDVFPDEVDAVELDKVVEEIVNDVSNSSVIFESHGFENVFLHGRAKCSIPFRGVVDKFTYVSHLMKSHKKYMRTLGSLLQEAADYCFVYDKCFDSSELLVNYDDYLRIQREEFYTLGDPSKLTHVNVVDCWCLLLNENEKNKESSKRFFFSASSSLALLDFDSNGGSERIDAVYDSWVEWVDFNKVDLLKFDLIVVPILKGSQYFLLLLNMKLRIVQWIDNVNNTAISEQQIKKLGDTMKDLLSTIFDEKMQFTNVIPLWKIERVSTDWKTTARTNIESDVFMMISMLFFEGTVDFRCAQLNAAPLRHVARAKIAGSLLLSDFNKQRSNVLDELSNFKDKRRAIAKQVSIRRAKIR